MGLLSMAIILASAPAGTCTSYQGQVISPVPIRDVFAKLPSIAPRGPYESTAEYTKRLETAAGNEALGSIVIDRPWGDRAPTFNADKSTITIYGHTFGQGRLNFAEILQLGYVGDSDSFGGIGFELSRNVSSKTEYEATNGFGAKVKVELTEEKIDAIFETQVKLGDPIFFGEKRFKPLAMLTFSPSDAKNVIEQGGAALVAIPKPPFVQNGSSVVPPTFRSPREVRMHVRVLWADVRCALIYDGTKRVVAAFEIK